MAKFINIVKKEVKKNKLLYIISLIIFIVLVYTHLNTFVSNDDLPYSFFYRGDERVKSLGQIFANQLADYKNLNGRFFVHFILQFVLMFGKTLWSFINPLMIVTSLIMLVKIIKLKLKCSNNLGTILLVFMSFFLMFNYKAIIYWVAGSVNYVWVYTLLLIILYLYYRYGFSKYKIVNILVIAFLCALHECTMVFTIIFMLGNIVVYYLKNKCFNKDYFIYCLGFIGSLFLLLCPASQIRMDSDVVWNNLSFFSKLQLSIPIVSKNLFNLTDITNVLPYIFITFVILNLFRLKNKISIVLISSILFNIILIYVLNNNWLYFVLVILLVISDFYSNMKNNRLDLFVLSLSLYAVIYSNIITPIYYAARPNYYFYIYMIFYVGYNFNLVNLIKDKSKIINTILVIMLLFLIINEVYVYSVIGNYHDKRLLQIEDFKKNESKETLELIKIPDKFAFYHYDANNPTQDWFTYRYFLNYYGLRDDIDIVYK